MKKSVMILLGGIAASMMLIAACGGGDDDSAPSAPAATARPAATAVVPPTQPPAAPAGGYQEIAVSGGGTISGVVSFTGTSPASKTLEVDKDPEVCGTTKPVEDLVVSSSGGVMSAVVSITDISSGKAITIPATTKLGQKDCLYAPHVLFGRVGGSLEVTNGDPLMHNVHSFTFDNPSINRAQPKDSAPITTQLEFPEIIEIGCDIHSWMSAWLVVAGNPYSVITGDDGSFSLTDVPAGTYEVEVWHETLGKSSQTVTVAGGETAEISFALASG